jgi:hypothetical protein
LDERDDEECMYIIYFLCHFKIDENVVVFVTWDVIYRALDTMWHLIQLQLQLQILDTNVHEIKCNKNEIVGFRGLIFFLNFFE